MGSSSDIGFQIRMLSNMIRRDVEKSRSSIDPDMPQHLHGWAITYFYENRDKDIFQKDFENKFSIRRSTASNMLKLMEKNGLIKREAVDSDARLKKISLTEKAIKIHKCVMAEIDKRELRLRKGLTPEEISAFNSIMKKLMANLEDNDD